MNKEKGFTLIELLAVIIVLAVVMLITVPKIFGVIADAQRMAAKDAAYGYVKAVEYEVITKEMDGTPIVPDQFYSNANLTVKGTKPAAVCLNLTATGFITSGWVYFDSTKYQIDVITGTVTENVSTAPACE